MKTNKSYTKRLKVTKRGKILARKAGQNHFNAKASGRQSLHKKGTTGFPMRNKDIRRYITTSF